MPDRPLPGPAMSRGLYTPVAISTASWRARNSASMMSRPTAQFSSKRTPDSSNSAARRSTTGFSSLKLGMP